MTAIAHCPGCGALARGVGGSTGCAPGCESRPEPTSYDEIADRLASISERLDRVADRVRALCPPWLR